MLKRVIITGASGFIGRALSKYLYENGYEIIALSRNPNKNRKLLSEGMVVGWDGKSSNKWEKYLDGSYGIINLAGENIGTGRWNRVKKRSILESRLNAGNAVINAIGNVTKKPKVLIQASAIGYYDLYSDEILNEYSESGRSFLSEVCRQWEISTEKAESYNVRHVIIRSGIVLGQNGGVFPRLHAQFKMFFGGYFGSGKRWLSWIHINDEIRAIRYLLEDESSGIFNLTAPEPIIIKDFCHILGNLTKRPSWLSIPSSLIRLFFGEMGEEILLSSQRVFPKRLLEKGFRFHYQDIESALKEIINVKN